MKYFQTLPTITQSDFNGNSITVTNLISRAYLAQSLKNNIFLYYDYTLKDQDRPEIIAHKFYNDQYRYWVVLYANNIFDVNSEWPLNYNNFTLYLVDKYKSDTANSLGISTANTTTSNVMNYLQSTIHHYEKSITTYNSYDTVKSTLTYQIDSIDYANTQELTNQYSLNDGTIITRKTEKRPVNLYDYENSVNESKRNVKLIKDSYAGDIENQLSNLMSA